MGEESSEEFRVPTNLRTLRIMEALAESREPLSPTQINQRIGLPKQSIHRLCQRLVDEGYLIRSDSGKRLQPSPRAVKMAMGLLDANHQNIARRQILLDLSSKTGETVNFVVPIPDGMTYLDRVETDWIFRIELPIGSKVPFYCTASGKCFLASLEPKKFEQMLKTMKLEKRTANTITSPRVLREEIAQVRDLGYSIDNEELFEGMIALSVPVLDDQGRYQASVAFHGPTQRLNIEKLLENLQTMRDGAKKLAALVG